jgi:suppressor of ftsI
VSQLTRRELMGLGATAAAGFLIQGCDRPVDTKSDGGTFQVLEVKWLYKTLNGRKAKLRSYNGQVPGPMITAHPGETLRIRLKNSLTPYDSTGWTGDHNIPHHLNSTNLHVHGLDVAPHLFQPLGTTDPKAPMIHVMPGDTFDYVFEVPKDHPPGLYWYHSHGHGSTAVQGVSGMAGAIIVKGDIDDVPEIKAARDITLAIQDIGLFPSETEADVWTYEPKQNAVWVTADVPAIGVSAGKIYMWDPKAEHFVEQPALKSGFTTGDYPLRVFLLSMGSDGQTVLDGEPFFQETHVNPPGTPNPEPTQLSTQQIRMAPGEVVRFRMLNACSDNLMPIVVEGHDMHLIALDGVNFPAPRTIPVYSSSSGDGQVLLAPANRAEFLVQAGQPGRYAIRELGQSQGFLPAAGKVIAEIVVEGPAKTMTLPRTLPTPSRYYPLIEKVSGANTLQFAVGLPATQNRYIGVDFTINGKQYQEDQVEPNNVVRLDEAQEWTLRNDHDHGGTEGHPFHIHMNHFEVISIGGVTQPPGTIQDTVWVPVGKPVVIRMKFRQFKGKSVFHCHILPHEDTGMMQNFLVL